LQGPYLLELNMTTQMAAEVLAYLPHVKRVDAFSVAARFERLVEVIKFVAFAMFYSPSGVIPL
jgi:D-aminopeptidase